MLTNSESGSTQTDGAQGSHGHAWVVSGSTWRGAGTGVSSGLENSNLPPSGEVAECSVLSGIVG
jgi:hypothetical protein